MRSRQQSADRIAKEEIRAAIPKGKWEAKKMAGFNELAKQSMSRDEVEYVRNFVNNQKPTGIQLEYIEFDNYDMPDELLFPFVGKPVITIYYEKITFSAAAVRLFAGMPYIQMPISGKERRIVVRPFKEEVPGSYRWARTEGDKLMSRPIGCRGLTEKIFATMGWDPTYRYRMIGRLMNSKYGPVLVFELDKVYPQSRKEKEQYTDPVTGKTKLRPVRKELAHIGDGFGMKYADFERMRQISFEEYMQSETEKRETEEGPTQSEPP